MTNQYKIQYSVSDGALKDGFLLITPENRWVWLKNSKGVTVQKGQLSPDKLEEIREGSSIRLGKIRVKVTKLIAHSTSVPASTSIESKPMTTNHQTQPPTNTNTNQQVTTIKKQPQIRPVLDENLLNVMRPHQIQGAEFLLSRLLGETNVTNSKSSNTLPVTGAILADDMGMGKTLTSLAVLWALIRYGNSKGIIVCPSGLVNNWSIEIKKWIPILYNKTIFMTSTNKNNKNKLITNFITATSDVVSSRSRSRSIYKKNEQAWLYYLFSPIVQYPVANLTHLPQPLHSLFYYHIYIDIDIIIAILITITTTRCH